MDLFDSLEKVYKSTYHPRNLRRVTEDVFPRGGKVDLQEVGLAFYHDLYHNFGMYQHVFLPVGGQIFDEDINVDSIVCGDYGDINPPFERMAIRVPFSKDAILFPKPAAYNEENTVAIFVKFISASIFDCSFFISTQDKDRPSIQAWTNALVSFRCDGSSRTYDEGVDSSLYEWSGDESVPENERFGVSLHIFDTEDSKVTSRDQTMTVADSMLTTILETVLFMNYPPEGTIHKKEPSELKNARRKKKGLSKLPDSYVIDLSPIAGKAIHSDGTVGTHKSPRLHLRRGHWRRHKDDRIWIKPCIVGSGNPVSHSYRVTKTESRPGVGHE